MTLPDRPPVYLPEPPRPASGDVSATTPPADEPASGPEARRGTAYRPQRRGGWFLPAAVLLGGLGIAWSSGSPFPLFIGIIGFVLMHNRG